MTAVLPSIPFSEDDFPRRPLRERILALEEKLAPLIVALVILLFPVLAELPFINSDLPIQPAAVEATPLPGREVATSFHSNLLCTGLPAALHYLDAHQVASNAPERSSALAGQTPSSVAGDGIAIDPVSAAELSA